MRVASLFAGCGGMDFGFKAAGTQLVWANDIDPIACKTYRRNIGEIVCGDIAEIDLATIPNCDLIIGGFPCQDFSVIWKQPGLDGKRGNLYKYLLEAVRIKKPAAFLLENVKGLLSANKGKAIEQIVKDFTELGYILNWKVINFADYGVPQTRQRVIIVGTKSGLKFPPEPIGDRLTAGEAIQGCEGLLNNERIPIRPRTADLLQLIPAGGNYTAIAKDSPYYVKGMISHVYRRIDPSKPSHTIIAAGGGGTWGYHYPEPRALTNRERARLQTFPDDFVFEGTIAEVRRQIGNAVPPKGIEPFARMLIEVLD